MKNMKSPRIALLGGAGIVLAVLHLTGIKIGRCQWKIYKTYKDCITVNNQTDCELQDSQWTAYVCPKNYKRKKYERFTKAFSRRGGFGARFRFSGGS
ncbi:MAG: hypothetical protein KBD64_07170 [Gammaproteobacteria bacterium]|nr:hypothetical protein [Gammaproteobacteria bacterium]